MRDNEMLCNLVHMAALGRRFQLGKLYNYKSDQILEDHLPTPSARVNKEFKLKLICPDPASNKWEHMGLNKHLQLGVLAGLIDEYGGASTYLLRRNNPRQVAQTLVCRAQSRMEVLDVPSLQQMNTTVSANWRQWDATHFVVGIVYGAEAYCVLTQDLDNDEEKAREEAEENLSRLVTKLEIALEDYQSVSEFKRELAEEEKQLLNRLKCRLYSDLQAETTRECKLTVFDAYKRCLKLIEAIKNPEMEISKSVPIFVILLPLKNMARSSEGMSNLLGYRDVNEGLVDRCFKIWTELEQICAKADTIRDKVLKIDRPVFRQFNDVILKFRNFLRNSLKEAVVKAREENGEEGSIEMIANIAESHPLFRLSQLEHWLDYKQTELEMVEVMSSLKKIEFVGSKIQLDQKLAVSFDRRFAVVLTVPSLNERTNEILKSMTDYVEAYTRLTNVEDEDYLNEKDGLPWHCVQRKRNHVMANIRELVNDVEKDKDLEEQDYYFIVPDESGEEFGCRRSIYEDGNLWKTYPKSQIVSSPPIDLQTHAAPQMKDQGNNTDVIEATSLCQDESHQQENCRDVIAPVKISNDISFISSQAESLTLSQIREMCSNSKNDNEFEFSQDNQNDISFISSQTNSLTLSQIRKMCSNSQSEKDFEFSQDSQDQRIAEIFAKKHSQRIARGQPKTYLLNVRENVSDGVFCCYDIGRPETVSRDHQKHKYILLMGATGCGKKTLIDGMVNYILGVRWQDPFRFKCVREDNAASQLMTAYTIHHHKGMSVPFTITIIDTPEQDGTKDWFLKQREIIGIDQIHAVCFVAASIHTQQLTDVTQNFIFETMSSIFGYHAVRDNVRMLVTSVDGTHLPFIEEGSSYSSENFLTVDGIKYNQFNNSVLYASNGKKEACFDQLSWETDQLSFFNFFQSLDWVKGEKALERQDSMLNSLEAVEFELEVHLEHIENMEMFQRKMKECGNKDDDVFQKLVLRSNKVNCAVNCWSYNCKRCQRTCQKEMCYFSFPREIKRCDHLFCRCPKSQHRWEQLQWCSVSEKQTTTLLEMKAELESKYQEKLNDEELIIRCLEEMTMAKSKVLDVLKSTSLLRNAISPVDYLNRMMEHSASSCRKDILAELQTNLQKESVVCFLAPSASNPTPFIIREPHGKWKI